MRLAGKQCEEVDRQLSLSVCCKKGRLHLVRSDPSELSSKELHGIGGSLDVVVKYLWFLSFCC